jgi:hypothetical protein
MRRARSNSGPFRRRLLRRKKPHRKVPLMPRRIGIRIQVIHLNPYPVSPVYNRTVRSGSGTYLTEGNNQVPQHQHLHLLFLPSRRQEIHTRAR